MISSQTATRGLLVSALLASPSASASLPVTPPNIVLIIADDQAYSDFGFMGNGRVHTPNLDRLAARSARYVNGYVPSSVCSPSLATILTGLFPHQHGIHFNHPPPGNATFNRMRTAEEYVRVRSRSFYLIRSAATLPRMLHDQAGYRCLQTGKFWEGHYSNAGFTHGMTIFEPVPNQPFGGNRRLAGGQLVAHGNGDWGLKIGRETMQPIDEFVDENTDRPFFIWYAPFLPHRPHNAPEKYFDLYRNRADIPRHRVPYYASISWFDDTVGRLAHHIEHRGLATRTVFLFVADNGWQPSRCDTGDGSFGPTRRSKRAPFEAGLRTPILIRWDGHVKPATHTQLASSIDIAPTLLAVAGLERVAVQKHLPGVNLLPSARGEDQLDSQRAVFGEIYPGDASSLGDPSRDVAYRWIRQANLKLIVPHRHGERKPWGDYLDRDALFDVAADPNEIVNLIDRLSYTARVQILRRRLDAWWTPRDDSNPPPPPGSE